VINFVRLVIKVPSFRDSSCYIADNHCGSTLPYKQQVSKCYMEESTADLTNLVMYIKA